MVHRSSAVSTSSVRGETRKGDIKHLSRLLSYLSPYRKSLLAASFALIITSFSVLGLGKGLGYLVDKGFGSHNPMLLNEALGLLLGITLILAAGTYARFYFITYIGERVIADIRKDIYAHLLTLSAEFFETAKTGDILSRITTDTTLLQIVIGSSLSVALRNILLLLGGIILLILTSPKLAGYVTFIVPVVVIPIITIGRKVRLYSRQSQDKVAALSSHAEESLNGIKTIQAFGRENYEEKLFSAHVTEAFIMAMYRVRMRALLTAIVIIAVFGAIASVLWIGGRDVLMGTMSAGALSSFMFYAILVASAIGAISEVIGDLQRAAGATERIFELLHTTPTVQGPTTPLTLPATIQGSLAFSHISFSYPTRPQHPALQDICLTIQPGEHIALVGPSGSGKSTLFQLLLRFYDAQSGHILLDGMDIRCLPLASLRAYFGLVPQDPVIFSDTVMNNIRFALPEASEKEVIDASTAAAAMEFIEHLPQGMHTSLGEKGVRLSGGQKQRIAIARALLKKPRILLLDEATSSLDTENEKKVQHALETLMRGRTTLVIAHRLSTVQKAHHIVVMHKGKIEAIGTHTHLLETNPTYKKLARSQFDGDIGQEQIRSPEQEHN